MSKNRMSSYLLIFFLMASLLSLNGCKKPVELQSKWLDKKITIDGNDNEWENFPFYYNEETRSRIGIYNDDENLYICFQTMDEDVQSQISRQGLLIWFNKTGDKEKQLALNYPMGRQMIVPGERPKRSSDMPVPSSDRTSDDQNILSRRPFESDQVFSSEAKILFSDDDKGSTYNVQEIGYMGIYVKCTIDQKSRFIYEFKIPLGERKDNPFTPLISTVKNIGIGFVVAESTKRTSAGNMANRDETKGGAGRGGMGKGGMGRGGKGRIDMDIGDMGSQGESLEIWTNITLASKPVDIQ